MREGDWETNSPHPEFPCSFVEAPEALSSAVECSLSHPFPALWLPFPTRTEAPLPRTDPQWQPADSRRPRRCHNTEKLSRKSSNWKRERGNEPPIPVHKLRGFSESGHFLVGNFRLLVLKSGQTLVHGERHQLLEQI